MVDRVLTLPAGTRLLILAPVIRGRKGEYKKLFSTCSVKATPACA